MSVQLAIDLEEEGFSALRTSPENFAREMRLAAAVKWYELGRISQEKAAKIAGLTRPEFMIACSSLKVSPFQCTPEELSEEVLRG